jgi:adenosylhomocysteine nucleosidase
VLVFVAAESREFEGLLRHVRDVAKLDWPLDFARRGTLNGREVALVANGPGPQLAGDAVDVAMRNLNVEALISTGFCGGVNRALEPCNIFAATEVLDVGPAMLPTSSRPFHTGSLRSLDRVLSTPTEKSAAGGDAVEMEAAAVAGRAKNRNIPFYAVRAVTDAVWETLPLDFNRMRSADGRFSRAKIIAAALLRPVTALPRLIELNRRTKRAAMALGDFLADARF